MPLIYADLAASAVSASEYTTSDGRMNKFYAKPCSITKKTPMDSARHSINLLDRSANYDVADIAQPRNVSESQHGKMMILKAIPHP